MEHTAGQPLSVNIPDSSKPRVVVIGGGFGGIHLLRRVDTHRFQVVLLDCSNYHMFQPLLYQVATAGLEPGSIAGPLRKIIRRKKDVFFRMLKAERIDPENKILHTHAGTLEYDYLIIATGAESNFFDNDDIARYAFPLKTISDAMDLRSYIFEQFEKAEIVTDPKERKRLMTFVVVGGGPTGVELCGALAELKNRILPHDYPDLDMDQMEIYLIEGEDRLLPAMSGKASEKAKDYLESMAVRIKLNTITSGYDGHVVALDDGPPIEATTMVWAAGVKGRLIEGLGDGSIAKGAYQVDTANRVLSDPESGRVHDGVFAIGDVAHMKHPDYPNGLPGLAQKAIQQGRHLAGNLNRIEKGSAPKPFRYRNKGVMATVGRNKAVIDFPGSIRLSGLVAWLVWMLVHVLFLIGYRNKAIVLANWTWNYFSYDRGIRLILNPSIHKDETAEEEVVEEIGER